MISYRSPASFSERFGREVDADAVFEVERYLDYHCASLQARFDPASYYRLIQAMDAHDLGRDRGGVGQALSQIRQSALVVGIDSDVLYPLEEQRQLAAKLPNAQLVVVQSAHGHDGFLIEQDAVCSALQEFLSSL